MEGINFKVNPHTFTGVGGVKVIIIILVSMWLGLFTVGSSFSLVNEDEFKNVQQDDSKTPEYAQGELIVKLKENATLQDIQELNKKYQVTSTDKVFHETSSPQQNLQELKAKLDELDKEHKTWYWQLDKDSQEYKDYVAKLEKEKEELKNQIKAQEDLIAKIEERQKRAPEGVSPPNLDNIYLFKTSSDTNILSMAEDYKQNPNVEYAEPNYKYKVKMFPNDPYYSSRGSWGQNYDDLWGLKKIGCEAGWNASQGEGVIVAVVDTGLDYNHPDIWENVWVNPAVISDRNRDGKINLNDADLNGNRQIEPNEIKNHIFGWDYVNNDNDPKDDYGHGTHSAGTIAAVGNNKIGIIGVAPKSKIMGIKGLSVTGEGTGTGLANCLKYAADYGADVISNSWAGKTAPGTCFFEDVLRYTHSKGCVIVAAAGNEQTTVESGVQPANSSYVITVSAFDQNDQKCYFSNYGVKIDVAAPGGNGSGQDRYGRANVYNILSLLASHSTYTRTLSAYIVGNNYLRLAGTSMACPHVSGLAALILSRHPEFTNEQVRQVIRQSANDVWTTGWDMVSGYGRINAYNGLQIHSVLTAHINNLISGKEVDGSIEIRGSAYGSNFQYWRLEIGQGTNPTQWQRLFYSYTAVPNGLLGTFDTNSLSDGEYTLRLQVYSYSSYGKVSEYRTYLKINNVYISKPKGLTVLRLGEKIQIEGTAKGTGFLYYSIEYGVGENPQTWSNAGITLTNRGNYPIVNGVLGEWDTSNLSTKGYYTLRLTVNYSRQVKTESVTIYLDPTLHKGWPKGIEDVRLSFMDSPTIADVDGDKKKEVVVAYNYTVHIYKENGEELSGWPQKLNYYVQRSPIVADLDGNGSMEILIGAGQNLSIFNSDGTPFKDYRKPLWKYGTYAFCVANLDQDPQQEIIYANQKEVGVFNIDGSFLSGWPYTVGYSSPTISGATQISVGDIDGDKDLEIVFAVGDIMNMGKVYAFHHNGALVNGWPVDINKLSYELYPCIGDVDLDGKMEVVITTCENKVYLLRHNGIVMSNFPQSSQKELSYISGPVLADIDGDRDLEIVAGGQLSSNYGFKNILFVWHHTGNQLANWPVIFPEAGYYCGGFGTASVGDIDGDNRMEIIVAGNYPGIVAFNDDGSIVNGFPKVLVGKGGSAYRTNTPAIVDVDADGKVEVVSTPLKNFLTGTYDIAIWDLDSKFNPAKIEWGMFRNDPQHTGCYKYGQSLPRDTTPPTKPVVTDEGVYTSSTNTLKASWTSSDPESGIAEYQYRITRDSTTGTIIRGWTSTGTTASVTASGLNLQNGKIYYFSVKAKNGAGLWSAVGYSDGITVKAQNTTPPTIPKIF